MDFFRAQDVARRNTVRLVILFTLAVISLVAITNLLIIVTLGLVVDETGEALLWEAIDWRLFLWISLAVIGVIAFGSVSKMASLSGGGARVAEMMQASLIVDGSGDPEKQRVLNVVEEMAIASGMPVPPVYLLEEESINAFAAGHSPADAVIGVTRGAISKLSREELQGVIAHEFSHILHGDMRLNMRLIGILHGIMILGLMGYYLIRTATYSRRSRSGSSIPILGIGLVIIGYAGTFFGNMIKASVSRQREYLADASAVQYTRNPTGIANALKRIAADSHGSALRNPAASEISHALFSNGMASSLTSLFATHPPLERRIRSIDPAWDGSLDLPPAGATRSAAAGSTAGEAPEDGVRDKRRELALMAGLGVLAERAIAQAGELGAEHLRYAEKLHQQLPDVLLKAAHDPYAARALTYVLVLSDDDATRETQLQYLAEHADTGVHALVLALQAHRQRLEAEHRLPLINIALAGMRQMSAEQYALFRRNLAQVLSKDGNRHIVHWVIHKIVTHNLDQVFPGNSPRRQRGALNLKQVSDACVVLLSWLVHYGEHEDSDKAEAVFQATLKDLELPAVALPAADTLSLAELDQAVDRLSRLQPLLKPRLLKACAECIAADGRASTEERELFRAVAETIDCPMPPLLP